MASTYPVSLDTLSTTHQDNVSETIHAATDNDQSDAINHIERELGLIPKDVYADVASRFNVLEHLQFNNQNVTAYTLVLGDKSKVVCMTNAAASTITVPANASVAFPVGTQILIRQGPAAGAVTIQGASGVTVLSSPDSNLTLAGATAWATLVKTATNSWDLMGDLLP